MQVSEDEFQEWLQNPVTEWVMEAMTKAADAQKAGWADIVWGKGEDNPVLLIEARTRADCYRAVPECSYEDWEKMHDSET